MAFVNSLYMFAILFLFLGMGIACRVLVEGNCALLGGFACLLCG